MRETDREERAERQTGTERRGETLKFSRLCIIMITGVTTSARAAL